MSLRLRVLVAMALVLLTSFAVGAGLAGWRARQALREELSAAMAGGRQAAQGALRAGVADEDLRRLVSTFDGNRHLRARLVGADGRVLARSIPAPEEPSPAWFDRAIAVETPAASIPGPSGARVVLTPDWRPDVSALWAQFQGLALGAAAVLALGAGLAWLMVGRALRPLADLAAAFERIGSGDYRRKVRPQGPAEIARLGQGVNEMASRLAAIQDRNRALEEQLLTLQDEERADLARDLHDEIGPHLFAVNVDAAMAGRLIDDGKPAEALEQVRSIQAAVAHMQRLVRDILSRLRPTPLVELGLAAAIDDLVAFWRARRPDIALDVDLAADDAGLDEPVREAIYRLVQEGLANAVRHGQPTRITVAVSSTGDGQILARVSDDGAGDDPPGEGGFGLLGMRERVEQAGGVLSIGRDEGGRGWTVSARLPRSREPGLAA